MLSSRSTKTSPGRIFICLNINNWLIETKTLSNFFLDDGYQLVQRLLTRAGCRIWPPDVPRWNQRQQQSSRWRCWWWCWWGGPAGGCRTCTGVLTGNWVQWQGGDGWYWGRCAAATLVHPYWPMLNLTLLSCQTAILMFCNVLFSSPLRPVVCHPGSVLMEVARERKARKWRRRH